MGYKSLIARQVQNAMKTLGTDEDGLATEQTYVSTGETSYNPETRRVEASEVVHEGVPMALVGFKLDDVDENVKPQTDRKAIIAALDLPVAPKEADKIRLNDGTEYNVRRLLSPLSAAVHKLHIRRVS